MTFPVAMSRAANSATEVLRIGITPNYAPLAFEKDGVLQGLEVDMAKNLGLRLGRDLRFVKLPWHALLPALENKDIDIVMTGMTITPARSQRVAFTAPYLRIGQMGLVRVDSVGHYARLLDLYTTRDRVGFEQGSTGHRFAQAVLTNAILEPFDSVNTGVTMLRQGRIDLFIHDAPTIWNIAGKPEERDLIGLYWPLTEEYLAWAVRKDDAILKRSLDRAIEDWKAEGYLNSMINHWIPVQVQITTK